MSTIINHTQDEPQTMKNLQWLKKGSKLERILFFTVAASLLIIAVLIAALIRYHHKNKIDSIQKNLSNVCLTPGCVKAAAAIISSLDEKVNPCDDFYRFACGEWIRTHQIPDDKSSISLIEEAQAAIDLQLKALLETKLDDTVPRFIRMTKEFLETCMDIKSIEKAGAEPLTNVLKSLGGWPVVEGGKWEGSRFDWIETLIFLRKLGYSHNTLLDFSIRVDDRHSSRYTIVLDDPELGTDRSYLIRGLNDSVTAAYYKKMVKAATLFGAEESTAKKDLLDAMKFEMILANYSLPPEERRNISKLYNKYTVETLREMAPQVPWLKYIRGLLMYEIYENETLIVQNPEFIKQFADLITNTEKRVLANYMLWRAVDDSLPLLSKEWRDIKLEYDTELIGKSKEKSRWDQCLSNILGMPYLTLDIALSSYYIQYHFKAKTKDQAVEIQRYVHKEFLRILDESDWMDEKTKAHAKAKANNMIFLIAYPEELLNNTAVMEFYKNLTLTNDSYFENILRIIKWSTDDAMSLLRKPVHRQDWKEDAALAVLVNAFYYSASISITFTAGHLINPFFSTHRPNYLNFGAIGSTFGHEITHGFDDKGRQYDKDGNNVNWWEKVTDENFRKKAQCIIDQYSNYTAENGMKLNGVNTQGENIADNGGVKESYWAYQSWVKDNGPEQLLPGLKYSQSQLFWISYASFLYCAKYRPEYLNAIITSDTHSPNQFRVIGPLSNLAEFAKDFNCPPDSPMNKKNKCQVW